MKSAIRLLSWSKQSAPLAALGEESVSLPRGGIALRYADDFGRVRSSPFGDGLTASGIFLLKTALTKRFGWSNKT